MDHLKGVVYREPENEGESWRQYLVIYDTVPGEPAPLKELMRTPDNLLKLFGAGLQGASGMQLQTMIRIKTAAIAVFTLTVTAGV